MENGGIVIRLLYKQFTYRQLVIKRKLESLLIAPLVYLGKLAAVFKPDYRFKTYYFFPFYHTGGAEKIHVQITTATANSNTVIIFTRRSVDDRFLKQFKASGATIWNFSGILEHKLFYPLHFFIRGYIAGLINKQKQAPVVFNGQCNFAYKIAPWIHPRIQQIELLHSFNSFSWIRLPFISYYATSVMISKVKIATHLEQYDAMQVPKALRRRIHYIGNAISLDKHWTFTAAKYQNTPFKVLYVGRNSPEKRLELIFRIAEDKAIAKLPIQFVFAGDIDRSASSNASNVTFLGNITDQQTLNEHYKAAQVLILASSTEGFPLVVMEAMQYGGVVVATPVGDIPLHLDQFLTSSITEEDKIVAEITAYLLHLFHDRASYLEAANRNWNYSKAHFDLVNFDAAYRKLIS